MPKRPSAGLVCAITALVAFTIWINWRAKAIELDLGVSAQKLAITGRQAPDFHLQTVDGKTVSLSDFRGRKLGLIFWASWNNGSHPAMLSMGMLYRSHEPTSNYDIVAICVGDEKADVQKFLAEQSVTMPVVLDPSEETARAFHVRSIPSVVVVDQAGKVTWSAVGFTQRMVMDVAHELGIENFRMGFGGPNGRRN